MILDGLALDDRAFNDLATIQYIKTFFLMAPCPNINKTLVDPLNLFEEYMSFKNMFFTDLFLSSFSNLFPAAVGPIC